MGESLTQQRRVIDEALRSVKTCHKGREDLIKILLEFDVPYKKAPANLVPAAAVILGVQALSGIIGRKGCVGVQESYLLNPPA